MHARMPLSRTHPVVLSVGAKGGSEVAPSTKQPSISGLAQAAAHAACESAGEGELERE